MDEKSVQIVPDQKFEKVREKMYVGSRERVIQSESRRRYLQKVARLMTRSNVRVELSEEIPSGMIEWENDRIIISSKIHDQPVTDLEPKAYDIMRQEGHLTHEIGHALYTNYRAYEQHLDKLSGKRAMVLNETWNVLEDGALERKLMMDYNVRNELETKNANMAYLDPDTRKLGTWREMISGALFDLAKYNTGFLQYLLSGEFRVEEKPSDLSSDQISLHGDATSALADFVETAKPRLLRILTESNPRDRTWEIYEFFDEEVEPTFNWDVQTQDERTENWQKVDGQKDPSSVPNSSGQEAEGLDEKREEFEQEMEEALGDDESEDEQEGDDEDDSDRGEIREVGELLGNHEPYEVKMVN
jgi:hypothetical protein